MDFVLPAVAVDVDLLLDESSQGGVVIVSVANSASVSNELDSAAVDVVSIDRRSHRTSG